MPINSISLIINTFARGWNEVDEALIALWLSDRCNPNFAIWDIVFSRPTFVVLALSTGRARTWPITPGIRCSGKSPNTYAEGPIFSERSVLFIAFTDIARNDFLIMFEWAIESFLNVEFCGWWYLSPILTDQWDSIPIYDTLASQSLPYEMNGSGNDEPWSSSTRRGRLM